VAETLFRAELPSPLGRLSVVASASALCAIAFEGYLDETRTWLERRFGGVTFRETRDPAGAVTALRAYLAGELAAIDALKVDLGGTPFQREVWTALRRIPAGRTVAYGELAASLGRPAAVRAVGLANGRNPIPIVVPCHRVIGADGSLTGYGGGLHLKRWLLVHEGARLA
jgi:methylated-DNA-[protein]-cysteine S-methyltransferase